MKTTIIGDEYKELFEEAATHLVEIGAETTKPQITNLSQYFRYLPKLIENGYYEFLKIPVNEEEFIIDTTSRMIHIPSNINPTNKDITPWVVGIVGDHRAETLWFKVDRYFDGQDLGICFPIEGEEPEKDLGRTYIVWKNGGASEFDQVQYVYMDEDTIHFGWTLRNDALYRDGDLTFAVSFNYHNGLGIDGKPNTKTAPLYSFNTQYITVPVRKSMNSLTGIEWGDNSLIIEENIEDQNNFPRFSGVYNSSRGARPEIITDLQDIADLDDISNMVELEVKAKAVGQDASLKYRWLQNGTIVEYEDKADNKYEANSAGIYQAQIGNQKGDITRWIDSSECIIPTAAQPVIKNNIYEKGYVSGEEKYAYPLTLTVEHGTDIGGRKIGTIYYDWYYTDLSGNNKTQITIENDDGIAEADENGQFNITLNPTNIGIYSVEVYNKHNGTDSEKVVSNSCIVKKNAINPTSVTIEYGDDNILRVSDVDIANNYDLQYQWSYVENIDAGGTSTDWSNDNTYRPTRNGIYHCKVRQNVFADDNSYRTYTAGTTSNSITVNNL